MNKGILLFCFLLAPLTLSAQFRPAWLASGTSAKGNVLRAVGHGKTPEDARFSAVSELVGHLNIVAQDGSLRKQLLDAGTVPDQGPALTRLAARSAWFKTVETFAEDTACWAQCELKAQATKSFIDSVRKAAMEEGLPLLRQARSRRDGGDLYGAAADYAKALALVTPVLHQSLTCDELEGQDLACLLYAEYAKVYDGLAIDGSRHAFPMVKGRAIPETFSYKLTSQGKPVVNMPVRAWFASGDGRVQTSRMTAGDGTFTAQVDQAPDADAAQLCASVDASILKAVAPTLLTPALNHIIDSLAAHPWTVSLRSFDPSTWCFVEIDRQDSAEVAEVLPALLREAGDSLATRAEDADLVLKMAYSDSLSAPYKAGDFMLANYVAGMTLTLQTAKTGQPLMTYELKDLRLVQPARKERERMRQRAVAEMMKRVKAELPARLATVNYDKPAAVFSAAH